MVKMHQIKRQNVRVDQKTIPKYTLSTLNIKTRID